MTLTLNQNMVDNDWLPPFSLAEYRRRFELVRAGMRENGLDALVIYGAYAYPGRDLGNINAVYLSNYAGFAHSFVVVPLDEEPTMYIMFPEHLSNAKDMSCLTDIRAVASTRVELGVTARLKELDLERGTIGVVGPLNSWYNITVPAEHRDHFESELPDADFRVVSGLYERWRLVKSPEELEHLRRGAAITDVAQEAIVQATRPGISHHELSEIGFITAQQHRGNTSYIHMGSSPMTGIQTVYPDPYPTHKRVGVGEIVQTEHTDGFGGYYGKLMATWFTGTPTKEYRRMFEVAAETYREALAGLRPGMTMADANRLIEPVAKAGYTVALPLMAGYSTYNHPPMGGWPSTVDEGLRNRWDATFEFEPGVSVRMGVVLRTKDYSKGLWVASACVFTETGLESLHSYDPSELRVVDASA